MAHIFNEEVRREKYVGSYDVLPVGKHHNKNDIHSYYRKKYGVCGTIKKGSDNMYVFLVTHLVEDNIKRLEEKIDDYKKDLSDVEKNENDVDFNFIRFAKMKQYLKLKKELDL
jgi:hypothetical protein